MKLPNHKCGLYLTHNEHRDYYESAEVYLDNNITRIDFESPEHRQRCIDTDNIWVLQWYPNTPVGFNCVGAPTLEELLDFANREE